MSRVGVVVISYRADPAPLFDSIISARHEVRPYIFSHGHDPVALRRIDEVRTKFDARCFLYGINRGVARSWNEGIHASFEDGNDVTVIVNDDLFFYQGGFDAFIDFVDASRVATPNFGVITTYGKETGTDGVVGSSQYYHKANWQGGACLAIGRAAVETIGYFDQNFWPAYFEDGDYFRRLELCGLPVLWDERTLLEHNRSYSLRSDPFLRRLHGERNRRNEAYYRRKWGGVRGWIGPDAPPGSERFRYPFDEPRFDCRISWTNRDEPYGAPYDREDLHSAASMGLLESDAAEELLAILTRHGSGARRLLEWGAGGRTMTLAGFAQSQQAELLLAVDRRAAIVRRLIAELPHLPFLHLRCLGPEEQAGPGEDVAPIHPPDPTQLGILFDVIVIGGPASAESVGAMAHALTRGGVVIVNRMPEAQSGCVCSRPFGFLFDVAEATPHYRVLRRSAETPG